MHTDIQTFTHIQTDMQTDRQTARQADRQTGRQADRQPGRQADRQTYTHTYMHAYMHIYIHTYIHTCIHAATCARGAGNYQFAPSEPGGLVTVTGLKREEALWPYLITSLFTEGSVSVCLSQCVCLGLGLPISVCQSVSRLGKTHMDEHTHDVNNTASPGCAYVRDVKNAAFPGRRSRHRQRMLQKDMQFYQLSKNTVSHSIF